MKIIKFSKFTSARISIEILKKDYIHDLFLIRSNENVVKFVDKPIDKSEQETLLFFNKINAGIIEEKWFYWGIYDKAKDKLMGTICLWQFNKDKTEAEIGFELHPSFQGNGFMSEAIPFILSFAFNKLKLIKVIGFTHSKNEKSIQLLKKHQFKLDRIEKEHHIYILTKKPFNTIR